MKILAVEWRASGWCQVGIVAIETGIGGWKAYIGAPLNVEEQSDALFIANHGSQPQFEGKTYEGPSVPPPRKGVTAGRGHAAGPHGRPTAARGACREWRWVCLLVLSFPARRNRARGPETDFVRVYKNCLGGTMTVHEKAIIQLAGRMWVLLRKLRPLLDRLPWDVEVGAARKAVDDFIQEGERYWQE